MKMRDLHARDEADWLRLWSGYLSFYESKLPNDVTNFTWQRAIDPHSSIIGRVAELDGEIIGFSLSVLHSGTWTKEPICYLEDLFVDPSSRGSGAGRALIQDLVDLAKERDWSRLYWHTRQDNAVARRLYDKFTPADDFVRYRLVFD